MPKRLLMLLLIALFCLQTAACSSLSSAQLSQQELAAQIQSGTAPLILDVRTEQEYEAGHIPGAINIHFRDIEQQIHLYPWPKSTPILVYCERGIRANLAESALRQAGFTAVLHLQGDMAVWRQSDRPIERGVSAPSPPDTPQISFEQRWVVTASEAKQLIAQGATVLDARQRNPLAQSQTAIVDWKDFSPNNPVTKGQLLDNDEVLTERLQALGISNNRPVVVFADLPRGWGEDGRIVWMLRSLGHPQAVMVDGGIQALRQAQVSVNANPTPGDFIVQRNATWTIEQEELQTNLHKLVLIDTREPREFAGATPYGEQRGGHLPGAINLYFQDFVDSRGRLLSDQVIHAKLRQHGISLNTPVVAYCTGGIRSGWLTTVLANLGYSVKNYPGSMWEWSASPADQFPLVTPSAHLSLVLTTSWTA